MNFIRKAVQPPNVKEGDVLKARIIDIRKITSKYKDDQGNPKEQLEFTLELESGYKFRCWVAFYEHPSDKSKLGKLALKLMAITKKDINNIEEFLEILRKLGQLFVKVKGFRQYEEQSYPNFAIVTEKMPSVQEKLDRSQDVSLEVTPEQYDAKQLLAQFKEAIALGLPLNQDDWNRKLLVEERIFLLKQDYAEKKQDLYYFTTKTQSLFQQ